MTAQTASNESRDLLRQRWAVVAIYWLPAAAIVASGFFAIPPVWRGALWAAALVTMGIGCISNALRCHRVHCYATGPFFLVMAIIALIYGFGAVSLGELGWNILGALIVGGALVLYYLPERVFGKYRHEPGVDDTFK